MELTPQVAQSESRIEQGCSGVSLAELRRQLDRPSELDTQQRQRLFELNRRLARVRALGGGFVRVSASEHVQKALAGCGQGLGLGRTGDGSPCGAPAGVA
jgi:hypothetical protein